MPSLFPVWHSFSSVIISLQALRLSLPVPPSQFSPSSIVRPMSILCLKFTDAPPRTWGSPVQTLYHLTPDLLSDQVSLFPLYPTIRICAHPSRLSSNAISTKSSSIIAKRYLLPSGSPILSMVFNACLRMNEDYISKYILSEWMLTFPN